MSANIIRGFIDSSITLTVGAAGYVWAADAR